MNGGVHVPNVSKAVSLNLLEPSQPVISLYRNCVPSYLPGDLNSPPLNSQETLCFMGLETYRYEASFMRRDRLACVIFTSG